MAVPGGVLETLHDIPAHVWKGLPEDMRLGPSAVNQRRIGVWASRLIPKGKRFGPFTGERKKRSQVTSNVYMWEVYFPARGWMCVDATDPMKGNWLRYVNWAHSSQEQNLFPLEINRAVYYKVLRPIGPGEELLVWYNGEDNPEIAAALEEERASKKNSPRAKRARKKLLERARQAGLGGFRGPEQTGSTKPLVTEMRDSEEGLNEEDEKPSPSMGLVQEPVSSRGPCSTVSEDTFPSRGASSALGKDPSPSPAFSAALRQQEGDEEDQEELLQPRSQQSPQHPTQAEPEPREKNEQSDLQLSRVGPAAEASAGLCETASGFSLIKPEPDPDPDLEDDPQGETYPCQHCERHFSTKQGLERHTHIHTTANHQTHTFKCRYCGKPFGSQVGRRRHERRHENGPKKRPGSLAGTATLLSPVLLTDTPSPASTPSQLIIMGSQNGAPAPSSEALKKDPTTEADRPFVLDENGESKELHPCKYCNKAFGTHTNMRRHQRRIHERHLLPKGVRRKGMLLQEVQSQQQPCQTTPLQEQSPSASPPLVYVPCVDTEDEGEREEYMVDISNNISENLSLYIDGKILSTSTVSNCEVIEVDSSSAALFGLDALIISPDQISQALKVEARTSSVKQVLAGSQSVTKRRTSTPPLLPNVKMESETVSSSASFSSSSSTSSPSSLLVGNLFPQSTETLAFQKEKTIYLSPKLKQLLQTQDGQKPTIALMADSHRLAPPLSITSLPASSGRFKRRTTSPPTSPQHSPALKAEGSKTETGVPFVLKVPKVESLCMSPTWSLSSKDERDTMSPPGKDWSASRSGGNACNQQPLDLSKAVGKRDNSVSKGPGESVLDLSMNRKSTVDLEAKGSSSLHSPLVKKKKPNTSMLEKVLLNEYAGLNPAGEESSSAFGSPDALSSPSSSTGVSPSSPSSNLERPSSESMHPSPPSLTPMTLNPSSPCSSSLASTPPPPVLPTAPSPLSTSPQSQPSDLFSYPVLSPKMSPRQDMLANCDFKLTESGSDAIIYNYGDLDQTAKQLDSTTHALLTSCHDSKTIISHCGEDSFSKSKTLLEGSSPTYDSKTNLSRTVVSTDSTASSHSEGNLDSVSMTNQSNSSDGPVTQDLELITERWENPKSFHSPVRLSPSTECPSDLPSSHKVSPSFPHTIKEEPQHKEEPAGIAAIPDDAAPSTSPVAMGKSSVEVETEQDTFTKSFVCNVCEEPFRSIKELSRHITEHAEEWPFKCEFCVQLFGNATALLEHRSSLHGVGRIYICSTCTKEFAFLCNLQQHQKDLHPDDVSTHTAVENGKLRPQNYTDPAKAHVENNPSNAASDSTVEDASQDPSVDQKEEDVDGESGVEEDGQEDPTEELYTTIKIMASEAGKPKGPDVRLGMNQHYPSFKPPPFPYHNRTPAGSIASATNFTTHNIPQTFSTAIRCTKCGNSFDNMPELHKHILACANASDKRRYTPKKNPIPLRQIVKPQNGVLSPAKAANAGQNAFRRMGQPKRLNFSQEPSSKVKMNALNKKKNQLVQKAISQKNKSAASAKKASSQVVEEELEVHVCPHCGREFTYPASLNKHIAVSCPMKPVLKKSKKVVTEALYTQDKNMNLRKRTADAEIKQEPDPALKTLGKTRARSSEPAESEGSLAIKGKTLAPPVRAKRPASYPVTTVPISKKSKKGNLQSPTQTPPHPAAPSEEHSPRLAMRVQRMGKELAPKKMAELKAPQQPPLQLKKEERFSLRARERVGGPITRSLQMVSATAPAEVKTEDVSSQEPREAQESMFKLAR